MQEFMRATEQHEKPPPQKKALGTQSFEDKQDMNKV